MADEEYEDEPIRVFVIPPSTQPSMMWHSETFGWQKEVNTFLEVNIIPYQIPFWVAYINTNYCVWYYTNQPIMK